MSKRGPRGLGRNQVAYERYVGATDVALMMLALLWLPVLIIPWVTKLPHDVAETFTAIDLFVWAVFVVDYLVRFYLVPDRRRFFTHHLLDLTIVVVPFFRPLRALRLVRLLNLGRVVVILGVALRRSKSILTHKGLHFVLLTVVAMVFVCAGLVLVFERNAHGSNIHNFPDALWWAIVTVTTIGYGDHFPVTEQGRAVAVVMLLVGIGLIGVLTATVASFFVTQNADKERNDLVERLERIEAMLARLAPAQAGYNGSMESAGGQDELERVDARHEAGLALGDPGLPQR